MKREKKYLFIIILAAGFLIGGCGAKMSAPADSETAAAESSQMVNSGDEESRTAGSDQSGETEKFKTDDRASDGKAVSQEETASQIEVVTEELTPVYGTDIKDGNYQIKVDSSSSMFRITACELTVKNGGMRAVMTMGGTGYLKLYLGTGEEAVGASEEAYISYEETEDGEHTFEIPIEALDMGIPCSAFSKKKEKWYDRILVFRSDSLPVEAFKEGGIITAESLKLEDGSYSAEVILEGGSGRAAVESPAGLTVRDGKISARIIWGSSNYDYMKVDGEKFSQVNTDGNSAFEIPISGFDRGIPVIADTIAMSEPHEIEYTLTFASSTLKKVD